MESSDSRVITTVIYIQVIASLIITGGIPIIIIIINIISGRGISLSVFMFHTALIVLISNGRRVGIITIYSIQITFVIRGTGRRYIIIATYTGITSISI